MRRYSLTYEIRLLVRKIAENYLKSVKGKEVTPDMFPIDVETIISDINGTIIECGNNDLSDGFIKYIDKGEPPTFEIHLKKETNVQRKRFTLAHELGHLVLHMDFFDKGARAIHDENYYRTAGDYTEKELQADEFAYSVLMPSKIFMKVADNNMIDHRSKYNVKAIAQYFGVSELKALTRGRWLGIFRW